MQRPPTLGQRFNRTRSARSTSIWCKRIKSDLLWRICGDIILPPFWRQEPLQRIGQDKRGGSFPFPRSSWLNQIIFPPFSVAALIKLDVPKNAWVSGGNWYCNDGYRKQVNECVKFEIPNNAFAQGSNWFCNEGYKKQGDSCIRMSQDELIQMQLSPCFL